METQQLRNIPAAHFAIGLHATTTHMLDRDLPVPASLSPGATCIEVFCYSEATYDAWVQSLDEPFNHDGPIVEQTAAQPTESGMVAVTFTAPLPDTGVLVRLRTYRAAAGLPGKHRRLEAVSA